jgi:hypothetical protein
MMKIVRPSRDLSITMVLVIASTSTLSPVQCVEQQNAVTLDPMEWLPRRTLAQNGGKTRKLKNPEQSQGGAPRGYPTHDVEEVMNGAPCEV